MMQDSCAANIVERLSLQAEVEDISVQERDILQTEFPADVHSRDAGPWKPHRVYRARSY